MSSQKVIFLPGSKNSQIHAASSGIFLPVQKSGENEKKVCATKTKSARRSRIF